ncbi:unnamed protein product [Arctia plantaginis]|uniref:Uncharacterized protein n=1 Tax=Arctia plantaginis TaxID=874455 RepID=A0A8S1BM95_ARCPL|nr:unnamed protein product [Arctia plantaginis]CAB3258042.1 unnamed protein product [Arctia plantaginis]
MGSVDSNRFAPITFDSARASCSTAADNCSPPPTSSATTFMPKTHAPVHQECSGARSSTSGDKESNGVRSSTTSGVGSGSDADSSVAGSSVVESTRGGEVKKETKIDKKQPPPVPARVTACITEETVTRKVKRRSRRSSSAQQAR